MFLKEILSKEKHVLNEIVDKKTCNSKLYEKSYVRNILVDSNCLHRVDNNKQFFVEKKRRKRRKYYTARELKTFIKTARERKRKSEQLTRRKSRRKQKKTKKSSYSIKLVQSMRKRERFRKRGHIGYSSYTTVHIYKSRKSNFIRFEVARFKVCRPNQFVDLFLKGIRTLITGRVKERENSLMLLAAEKGGFKCYSSGFRGFLPESQFYKMIELGFTKKYKENPFVFKTFLEYQRFRWFVSSPPRFRFVIKTFIKVFRFRRNNFVLSRKKSFRNSTRLLPKILFHSASSFIKKTRAQLTKFELRKKFDSFKRRIK